MTLHTKINQRGSTLIHWQGEMKWQVDFSQEWLLDGWGMIRRDTHVPDLEPGCLSCPLSIQWRANLESLPPGTKPLTLNSEDSLCLNMNRPGNSEFKFSIQSLREGWHGPRLLLCPNLALQLLPKSKGTGAKSSPSLWWRKVHFPHCGFP